MKNHASYPAHGLAEILIAIGFLTGAADAAVQLTFKQKGNDVVITLSGSTQIPNFVTLGTGSLNQFNSVRMDYIPTSQFHYTGLANPQGFPIISGTFDSSSTASVFSFNDRAVAFDFSLDAGATWAPTGDMVIKNQSFLTLFGSANPTLGPRGNWPSGPLAFSSVFVVPEPSGPVLLGSGLALFLLVRRRS